MVSGLLALFGRVIVRLPLLPLVSYEPYVAVIVAMRALTSSCSAIKNRRRYARNAARLARSLADTRSTPPRWLSSDPMPIKPASVSSQRKRFVAAGLNDSLIEERNSLFQSIALRLSMARTTRRDRDNRFGAMVMG